MFDVEKYIEGLVEKHDNDEYEILTEIFDDFETDEPVTIEEVRDLLMGGPIANGIDAMTHDERTELVRNYTVDLVNTTKSPALKFIGIARIYQRFYIGNQASRFCEDSPYFDRFVENYGAVLSESMRIE